MSFNIFSFSHILFISIPLSCWIKRGFKRTHSPDDIYNNVYGLIKGWIIFTNSALFSIHAH